MKPFVIVVGVDYSEISGLTFQQAWREAAQHADAELHLMELASLTLSRVQARADGPLASASSERLARLRTWLAEQIAASPIPLPHRPPTVIEHLGVNVPGDELCALATKLNAALIVVGVNSSNTWAMRVAQSATSSVLIVRRKPAHDEHLK